MSQPGLALAAAAPTPLVGESADLPTRSLLSSALLALVIATAFLALASGLGLLLASAVYGYRGLG